VDGDIYERKDADMLFWRLGMLGHKIGDGILRARCDCEASNWWSSQWVIELNLGVLHAVPPNERVVHSVDVVH
jgi:hypothetical protein